MPPFSLIEPLLPVPASQPRPSPTLLSVPRLLPFSVENEYAHDILIFGLSDNAD